MLLNSRARRGRPLPRLGSRAPLAVLPAMWVEHSDGGQEIAQRLVCSRRDRLSRHRPFLAMSEPVSVLSDILNRLGQALGRKVFKQAQGIDASEILAPSL